MSTSFSSQSFLLLGNFGIEGDFDGMDGRDGLVGKVGIDGDLGGRDGLEGVEGIVGAFGGVVGDVGGFLYASAGVGQLEGDRAGGGFCPPVGVEGGFPPAT